VSGLSRKYKLNLKLTFNYFKERMSQFKTTTIEDTEMIYSILRDKYPDRQIEIVFNDNTKEYFLKLTNEKFKEDPEVPVDIKIKVVYGDSVTGDTPVLLKKDDNIYIETIQSIFEESKKFEYPGFKLFDKTIRLEKEYCLSDYQIWSDIGWVNIKKVIRHKCEKKMYRVLTHTGCIDVTEDHSLITENKEPIKPVDLKVGDTLLHSFPKEFIENTQTIVKMKKIIEKTKQNNVEYNKNEQWIKLKDYNNYSVSSFGNIKNNITNKLMKPKINNGYYIVNIKSNDNKYINVAIHRLVAIMFLDNNENKHTVNHKNHNKLDNNLHNLEWATMNEQNIHKRKRENTSGRKILQYDLNMNYIQSFNTVREASRSINKEQYSTMISKVCKGILESYMNFIWKYDQENILKNEIWKELTYNKHIFNVSNYGRVKNKYGYSYGSLTDSGYLRTSSCFNKQIMKKFIHVLVAEAFISKINDNLIVNHKDGNKSNNNVNNLEWVTFSENAKHSHNIKKEIVEYILTEKEAEVWGFFMNYGKLIDTYYKCNVRKCYWYICNNDLKRLNYFKDILESVEPIKFEILDTLKSSGVYKLVPKGSIKYMVDKYRSLFYYQKDCNANGDKYKIVPNSILNASKEIKMAYWKGYYEADGAKTGSYNITKPSFAVKGKIGAQCMYYLMRSIGFDMGINIRENDIKKQEIYFLSYTNFKKIKETGVKKIIDKGLTNNYVYDIETEIGRFGSGVGQLQTFNTDSVFLSLKYNRQDFTKNRSDTFKLATICGDNVTDKIFNREPICLEFEKVFQPFILLTKKRYIGKKYENMKDPFKLKEITKSGIAITRRDYCKMVKNCYTEVIDCIVNEDGGGVDESVEIYKSYVDRIDNYQIDIDDLVVSAMLAKSYKTKPVHVQLAEKLKARHEEVQVGSRIGYIFIENTTGEPKQKSELGEDPIYAKKHNLKYNRGCYLSQLAKPLLSFFKVVFNENSQSELDELIEYTNNKLEEYDGKGARLRPSDYKLDE
jgi:hypothetical protein